MVIIPSSVIYSAETWCSGGARSQRGCYLKGRILYVCRGPVCRPVSAVWSLTGSLRSLRLSENKNGNSAKPS